MLTYQILEDANIVVVEPKGPLSEGDFKQLTTAVDLHLAKTGTLRGLLIHTESFPGWESFKGMLGHIRFVREHHRKIRKVAIASGSALAEIIPALSRHFVSAEVRRFAFAEQDAALDWLKAEQ